MVERVLLIEPNYKNKYPPIGLMKISTYYKSKGDFVQFHKGLLTKNEVIKFDKVLITTLFTFDFDMCVKTIKYYEAIVGSEKTFVGGIAATIMPENFLKEVPNINLLLGQLTNSNVLGYSDNVNIDVLPLDYDILWDIDYEYPSANSYFIYTSRGCPRKCSFCAVKTLEPNFYNCNDIEGQITRVDEKFGPKKQLLIMDNNILNSSKFEENTETFIKLGFGKDNNQCQKNCNIPYYLRSLKERIDEGRIYNCLLERIKNEFFAIKTRRVKKSDLVKLQPFFDLIEKKENDRFITSLLKNSDYLNDFFKRYHYHKMTRYIDFNQGLDARLLTKEKAITMSRLAVKPCRIAFDHIETKDIYINALETAVNSDIKYFSNYLLFNYKDKPEDLWERISINIDFCEKHKDKGISLFSFPMKYASIEDTDRAYVGKHWCKKYLRSINIVLNVTSGVVAKEKDFFERAYGKSPEEFIEILSMPDEFIRYRNYFEDIKLTSKWKQEYFSLSIKGKKELLEILSEAKTDSKAETLKHPKALDKILSFYSLRKNQVEKNLNYYSRIYQL